MTYLNAFLVGLGFIILWMFLIGWSWSMWTNHVRQMTLNIMSSCKTCGGTMIGDGVHTVRHCENALESAYWEVEPDAGPIYCGYEWEPFTKDFDYWKKFYDVMLPDGTIVEQCWPNAGKMNAINGDGRTWGHEDNIKVRLSKKHPMDDE